MICRHLADNITVSWAAAGTGGGFRCMSTKAPTSNTSVSLRKVDEQRRVPDGVMKFIDGLCRSALGRAASAQEISEISELIVAGGDRRTAGGSGLLVEGTPGRPGGARVWEMVFPSGAR